MTFNGLYRSFDFDQVQHDQFLRHGLHAEAFPVQCLRRQAVR